jgi:hypothetical protein
LVLDLTVKARAAVCRGCGKPLEIGRRVGLAGVAALALDAIMAEGLKALAGQPDSAVALIGCGNCPKPKPEGAGQA